MYYEIYVDTLFLLHFFMNLYMLALANCMLYHIASGKRLFIGAVIGAICAVSPFFLPVKLLFGTLCSFLISVLVMSGYTFRAYKGKRLFQVLEKMLIATLLLGGLLLFFLKMFPHTHNEYSGIIGVFALGTVCFAVVQKMIERKKNEEHLCKVFFGDGIGDVAVKALMDTGNTLIEPISGKPVVVVEEKTLLGLFQGKLPQIYRIIPYHSVGKKHGLLKGYLLEKMVVEIRGIRKECKNIYVAMSEELFAEGTGYRVILNPQMLER